MIIKTLEEFGFSNNESRIYLSLLELGPAIVSKIAKKAGINRSSAYVVLGFLIKRGIVSTSDADGVKVYVAANPERLLQLVSESARKYNELVKATKALIPKLKSIQAKKKESPKMQFFEGAEGIKTVYQNIFNKKIDPNKSSNILVDGFKVGLICPVENFAVVITSKGLSDILKKKLR